MTDTPELPPKHRSSFAMWLFICIVGICYGLISYVTFDTLFANTDNGDSGVMMASFLFTVPFCMGATIAYIATRKERPFRTCILWSLQPIFLATLLSIVWLGEGSICVLMGLPVIIAFSIMGNGMGRHVALARKERGKKYMVAFLALPFTLGAIEQNITPPERIYTIKRSIHIEADTDTIWHHINYPTNIDPAELSSGIAYRIGVPYPVEARTLEPKLGGMRELRWQRGVAFKEEIVAWDVPHYIEWIYHFDEDSFPAGSLDDHIKIGGSYFDLQNTSYRIRPQGNGSAYLDISVQFKVATSFNWYAAPWAHLLLGDTAHTILGFYKNRSERGQTPVS